MKKMKKLIIPVLMCILLTAVFTACHSHEAEEWTIDKDSHWHECECGEITGKGEHTFEDDVCTVCFAERKTEDGELSEMGIFNSYGDWTQWLYFDSEGAIASESKAEYTYDDEGNKLTDKIIEDGQLLSEGEYAFDADGFSYKKFETEVYEDGTKCVYEYNENGDSIGYVYYDEEGNELESYRSEYITDEEGNLTGEKVYENGELVQEYVYSEGSDEEEDYLYASQMATYSEDGSKYVEHYDEYGDTVKEISYDSEGKELYNYDLEYIYDDEGNLTSTEKKQEGVLKVRVVYEYDKQGDPVSEKTYEEGKLVTEVFYSSTDEYYYESKVVTHHEDGSSTVEEFDENGELIS